MLIYAGDCLIRIELLYLQGSVQGLSSTKMKEVESVAEMPGKFHKIQDDSCYERSDMRQLNDKQSNQAKSDADLLFRSATLKKAGVYEVKVSSAATSVDQPKRGEVGTLAQTASCELAVDSSSSSSFVLEASGSNDFDGTEQMKDSQSPYQRRHRSSLSSLSQVLDADVEGVSVPSPRARLTPQQRRAFPRTNPAYVASVTPGTGDRRYVRRMSTESSMVKSVSSNSLNRPPEFQSGLDASNGSINEICSAEDEEVLPLSKVVLKQERAIDCPMTDKNGNEVSIGSSTSLQGTVLFSFAITVILS